MKAPFPSLAITPSLTILTLLVAALLPASPRMARAQGEPELSATYMILKPTGRKGIKGYSQPDTIQCHIESGIADADVARRVIEIRRAGHGISIPIGAGSTHRVILPHNDGWDRNGDSGITDPEPYVMQLVVTDRSGLEHRSADLKIPVRVLDSKYERRIYAAGHRVSRYSLCLFKFDRAELGSLNERIVRELILPDIGKGAEVEVIGHMDIIGLADHNMRLSENRARSVVKILAESIPAGTYRVMEGRGVGEGEPLYTNALPEGRFYNRSTQVIVYNTPFNSAR